jgi:hypothetical protein
LADRQLDPKSPTQANLALVQRQRREAVIGAEVAGAKECVGGVKMRPEAVVALNA